MLKRLNNELGVGLVEMLISILIIAGVIAAIMVAYTNFPETSNKGTVQYALQQDASLALDTITKAIRLSTKTGNTVTPDQLTLSDGTVFRVQNGLFQKVSGGAAETLLGDYRTGEFSMQVLDSTIGSTPFTDNGTNPNTITVRLGVRLIETHYNRQTHTNSTVTVDTKTFRTSVCPRN